MVSFIFLPDFSGNFGYFTRLQNYKANELFVFIREIKIQNKKVLNDINWLYRSGHIIHVRLLACFSLFKKIRIAKTSSALYTETVTVAPCYIVYLVSITFVVITWFASPFFL